MDAVNAAIAASAPTEDLVNQPQVVRGVLRVSGPFTVEGVQPVEESLEIDSPISGAPEELETFEVSKNLEGLNVGSEPANAEAYLEKMLRLLRGDGVRFPDNRVAKFARLDPLAHSILHAEGEWAGEQGSKGAGEQRGKGAGEQGGGGAGEPVGADLGVRPETEPRRVAVSFGPQYGPVTAKQVEDCIRAASRRGYDDLVLAGFTFDAAAQAAIQEDPDPSVRIHLAHVRPDVNMGGLLKDTPGSQLFTVFGLPRVRLERVSGFEASAQPSRGQKPPEGSSPENAQWVVEMEGVDVYDPVTNTLRATNADKVAAWFLDTDYDGATFCITQAFFPDASAWEKLARAMKSVVDEERFAAFSGTRSLPFAAGKQKRVAVKVIDPRGNEVMRVLTLDADRPY